MHHNRPAVESFLISSLILLATIYMALSDSWFRDTRNRPLPRACSSKSTGDQVKKRGSAEGLRPSIPVVRFVTVLVGVKKGSNTLQFSDC